MMNEKLNKMLKDAAPIPKQSPDVGRLWQRAQNRRSAQFAAAVTIGAGIAASTAMVVANSSDDLGDPPSRANQGVTVAADPTPSQETGAECGYTLDDKPLGKTTLGLWLENLLVSVGGPSVQDLDASDVRDSGGAFQIDSEVYGQMTVYVAAKNPVDPELRVSEKENVGTIGEFNLYYEEGNPWKSMLATNGRWQLGIAAYPEDPKGAEAVPWTAQDSSLNNWFRKALRYAADDPPPCSNELID